MWNLNVPSFINCPLKNSLAIHAFPNLCAVRSDYVGWWSDRQVTDHCIVTTQHLIYFVSSCSFSSRQSKTRCPALWKIDLYPALGKPAQEDWRLCPKKTIVVIVSFFLQKRSKKRCLASQKVLLNPTRRYRLRKNQGPASRQQLHQQTLQEKKQKAWSSFDENWYLPDARRSRSRGFGGMSPRKQLNRWIVEDV